MGIRLQSVQIITMKFLVVVLVLAIAALAQAEPEADPGVLYGAYYGHPHFYGRYGYGSHYGFYNGFYARSAYGYGLPGHSYTHVDRLHKREADAQVPALPLVYANTAFPYATAPAAFAGVINPYVYNPVPVATAPVAPILPYAGTIPTAAGVAVAARPFTPYDCVTSDGCAVRALRRPVWPNVRLTPRPKLRLRPRLKLKLLITMETTTTMATTLTTTITMDSTTILIATTMVPTAILMPITPMFLMLLLPLLLLNPLKKLNPLKLRLPLFLWLLPHTTTTPLLLSPLPQLPKLLKWPNL